MPVKPEEPLLRRRRKWNGRYDLSELSPGGPTTSDESVWFPNLADLECRACGQTGPCVPGCPQEMPHERTIMKKCKVEGCENEAAAERGAYAMLCLAHREQRVLARQSEGPTSMGEVAEEGLEQYEQHVEMSVERAALDELVETNGHPSGSLLVTLAMEVERRREELDDAIAALRRQLEAVS